MSWLQDSWHVGVTVAGAFLIAALLLWWVPQRMRIVAMFWVGGGIIVVLVLRLTDPSQHWGCALALLPGMLICQHAVFLRLVRMPFRESGRARRRSRPPASEPPPTSETPPGPLPPPVAQLPHEALPMAASRPARRSELADDEPRRSDLGRQRFDRVFAAARLTSDRYFSASTLAVRYGAPAVAVALVGIIVFYLLFEQTPIDVDPVNLRAAQLGAAGAYVYVLLYLAQRNFRYDVTSGGAMWCAVVIAVGPLLACAMSHFFQSDGFTPPESRGHADKLSGEVVYFVAGLAPRHVTSFIVESVRRLWVSPSSTISAAPRTVPITQVRGITTEIAERLNEEGILDLYGLAAADPLRLIRNTNFDKRQIISWIDEAILIAVLPEQWQPLEREGFTGAIDLVWLLQSYNEDDFKKLAARLKLDDVSILMGVVDRLAEDAQLQLVWVLYRSIDRLDVQTDEDEDARATTNLPVSTST